MLFILTFKMLIISKPAEMGEKSIYEVMGDRIKSIGTQTNQRAPRNKKEYMGKVIKNDITNCPISKRINETIDPIGHVIKHIGRVKQPIKTPPIIPIIIP